MTRTRKPSVFLHIFTLILAAEALHAQQGGETNVVRIADTVPGTVAVLPGAVQGAAARTSYGAVAVCEGRMLAGLSAEGAVLWQRAVQGRPSPFVAVGPSDLLCVVTGGTSVSLLSPTGLQLWRKDTGGQVLEPPSFGRDGRIFVRCEASLSCYSLDGTRKWRLELPEQDAGIPLSELDDGSLLAFLAAGDGGNSRADHISPFGEVLSQVTFSGSVTQALPCDDGVLLLFSDGGAGLCRCPGGTLESAWHLSFPAAKARTAVAKHMGRGTAAVLSQQGGSVRVSIIRTDDGTVIAEHQADVDLEKLAYAGNTAYGFVVADSKSAVCLAEGGGEAWRAQYGTGPRWTAVFATDSGHLVFCGGDWTVRSYRMKQTAAQTASTYREPEPRPYSGYYAKADAATLRATEGSGILEALSAGDYGKSEAQWLPAIAAELSALAEDWGSPQNARAGHGKPWFSTNLAYAETLLTIAARTGTTLFQRTVASLLPQVQDPQMASCLARAAGNLAFDADGGMLSALDEVLKEPASRKNVVLVQEICDATVKICRTMGRPAYFSKGEDMLSGLLSPSYDRRIRDYAMRTLITLMKLSI